MKKQIAYMLLGIMALSLAGCKKSNEQTPEATQTPEIIEATQAPTASPVATPAPTPETPISFETVPEDNVCEGEHHGEIISLVDQRNQVFSEPDSVTKLEDIHNINKQIAELNTYDFSDKKITCIGDSITFGRGGNTNEYGNLISYVDYLSDILGCPVENMGVSGSTIGDYGSDASIVSRVKDIPQDTDIIVVFGGVNDYLCGNSVFGSEEVTEGMYYGKVKELFSKIRESFPDAEVFVVLTYKNALETNPKNAETYNFDLWLDVIRSYSEEYNFHKIEMYRTGFMNSNVPEIKANYFSDEIHPNDNGYVVIARYIAAKIVEVYN